MSIYRLLLDFLGLFWLKTVKQTKIEEKYQLFRAGHSDAQKGGMRQQIFQDSKGENQLIFLMWWKPDYFLQIELNQGVFDSFKH